MPPSLRKKRPRASAAASTPAAGKSTRKKPRQSSVVGAGPPADSETDRLTEEEQQPAQEALQPAQLAFSDGAGGGDDQESEDEECGEAGWVPGPPWRPLNVPPSELRLASTLMSGQSFRWERRLVSHATSAGSSWRAQYPGDLTELGAHAELDHTARHVEYVGPIDRHLFVLRETPTDVFFRVASEGSAPDEARDCLRKYLRLLPAAGAPLDPQALWRGDLDIQSSAVDPGLAERLQRFPGVRLLALPLLESVFCFMGSANNNIKRNSQMIASMCAEFPQNLLGNIGGTDFFAFPSLAEMATLDEARLSELGWGYRAPRFVKMCPELLSRGGVAWLEDLRGRGREVARERLCELTGVGRKVADCITLFSLCQDDCIPVRSARHLPCCLFRGRGAGAHTWLCVYLSPSLGLFEGRSIHTRGSSCSGLATSRSSRKLLG
jgi:hypothetical protein